MASQPIIRGEVAAAAQRQGVVPTPGMLTDDYITQGMEQSLATSPTGAGNAVRNSIAKATKGVIQATGRMLEGRSNDSAAQIGETVAQSLKNKLLERMKPLQAVYDELYQSASNIALKDKSKGAVAANMRKYAKEAFAPGTSQRSMMHELADDLEAATSVDQLKQIRSILRRQIQSIDPTARGGFGPIFDKLDRLERNSILRAAVEIAGKKDGGAIARGLIQKSKATNKSYRELMQLIDGLGSRSKISKSRTLTEFLNDLDDVSPELLGEKLFKMKDQKLLNLIKTEFPEVFAQLRVQKMNELVAKSQINGELSVKRLVSLLEKMEPEVRDMILGQNAGRFADIKTIARAMPGPINPSGTAKTLQLQQTWNPATQVTEALRYGLYRTGALPKVGSATEWLARDVSPQASSLAYRPLVTPALPTIEGYSVSELVPLDEQQKVYYRQYISQAPDLDSVQRAKYLSMINKEGVIPSSLKIEF
jgi:hypothetical protein